MLCLGINLDIQLSVISLVYILFAQKVRMLRKVDREREKDVIFVSTNTQLATRNSGGREFEPVRVCPSTGRPVASIVSVPFCSSATTCLQVPVVLGQEAKKKKEEKSGFSRTAHHEKSRKTGSEFKSAFLRAIFFRYLCVIIRGLLVQKVVEFTRDNHFSFHSQLLLPNRLYSDDRCSTADTNFNRDVRAFELLTTKPK